MRNMTAVLALAGLMAVPAFGVSQEEAAATDPFQVKEAHAEKGTVFYVNDRAGRDNVTFTSRAPLEDIIGTTNRIHGYIAFNPANPVAGAAGRFTVPVASLNTGIPLRDEHLQGAQWLNAEAHPDITIEFDNVRDVTQTSTGEGFATYEGTLVGSFTVNGITKDMNIPARVTYMSQSERTATRLPGNLLAGRAEFTVNLADHDITGGGNIGPKVSNEITVDVTFVSSDVKPEPRR